MGFYSVTTGWIFEIGLCENPINQSINPSPWLWKALSQVAVCVNGSKHIGLKFARDSGLRLPVFADADYTAKPNDQRSVSGEAVILGDTPIDWKSSTQKCVATATCEAKYVAMCDAPKDALFMRDVLVFLQPQLAGMRNGSGGNVSCRDLEFCFVVF